MINDYLSARIAALVSNASANNSSPHAKTELDSHANMAVLGKNCFVFEESGKTCQVSAFSPSIAASTLPIVDAVIIYDCPYSLQSYMLMIRNALYVKDMEDNLIPPFLLREAGLTVDECAKIHAHPQPTAQNHSIFFPTIELRIPLQLTGVFSFFIIVLHTLMK